jgi:hypothetical protein
LRAGIAQSVAIATGYGLDGRGVTVRVPVGARLVLGLTKPPIQWVPGDLSPGVKRPGRESDHSPPTSAEVENTLTSTSTSLYAFMAWCLITVGSGGTDVVKDDSCWVTLQVVDNTVLFCGTLFVTFEAELNTGMSQC